MPRLLRAALLVMTLLGCSDDDPTQPTGDLIPPRAINDLDSFALEEDGLSLRWTSPGDDGAAGQATAYDLRYSTTGLTEASWTDAISLTGLTAPKVSGARETFRVSGLARGEYSFAIKSRDEAENWSTISNVFSMAIGDSIPPSAIQDLLAVALGPTSISLEWTAPGDDGEAGTATAYDLRRSAVPITETNWDGAIQLPGPVAPSAPGTAESFVVTDLAVEQTYYFALRTSDGVNWSELSNIASASTAPDEMAPSPVLDLASSDANTGTLVTLTWTATGDDGAEGRADQYDVRFSRNAITEENWDAATLATDLPSPNRAGVADTATVRGLEPVSTYFFALKVEDEAGNRSSLSNVVEITTENFWQLTQSPVEGGAFDADWSPDGEQIVFRGFRNGNSDIYTISASGGPAVQMTNEPSHDIDPAWSPDGTRIAFGSAPPERPNYDLFVMDATPGATPTLIAGHGLDTGNPTWSPNGTRIAFSQIFIQAFSRYDVFVAPSTGGTPELLIPGQSEWANFSPAWSPDGARVAIISSRANSWDVWIIPLDGGSPFQVTRNTQFSVENADPAWSPDGSELLFSGTRNGSFDIYRVAATGGDPIRLTFDATSESEPVWSPDGDRMAFTSNRSGQFEIWIQLLD